MPLFYFHFCCTDEIDEDVEGIEFSSENSATADARIALIEMAYDAARLNIALNVTALIVFDWKGQPVATISMEDALHGFPTKH